MLCDKGFERRSIEEKELLLVVGIFRLLLISSFLVVSDLIRSFFINRFVESRYRNVFRDILDIVGVFLLVIERSGFILSEMI